MSQSSVQNIGAAVSRNSKNLISSRRDFGMKPKTRGTKYAPGVEVSGYTAPRWSSAESCMYADAKFEQEFNASSFNSVIAKKAEAFKNTQAWLKSGVDIWSIAVGAGSNRPQDPARWKPIR